MIVMLLYFVQWYCVSFAIIFLHYFSSLNVIPLSEFSNDVLTIIVVSK